MRRLPGRIESDRSELTAGGMPGDMDPVRIAAMALGIAVQPVDRLADMVDDVVHADIGDQRVIDDRDEGAGRCEGTADEAEGCCIERLPEPAVNEHEDRSEGGAVAPDGKNRSSVALGPGP